MSEETREVLKMLREGQVSVEEAERLLGTLEEAERSPEPRGSGAGAGARFLRIAIATGDGHDIKVNLPLGLAEVALKFIPQEALEELEKKNIDLDTILKAIKEDVRDDIVNIKTEDGDDIRIYVD